MQRQDIIDRISDESGLSKKDSTMALSALIEGIMEALERGDKLVLVGFGTFSVGQRKERRGLNPQTREIMTIPAKKAPVFKASKKLRELVN